jgi:hypothetical protein
VLEACVLVGMLVVLLVLLVVLTHGLGAGWFADVGGIEDTSLHLGGVQLASDYLERRQAWAGAAADPQSFPEQGHAASEFSSVVVDGARAT